MERRVYRIEDIFFLFFSFFFLFFFFFYSFWGGRGWLERIGSESESWWSGGSTSQPESRYSVVVWVHVPLSLPEPFHSGRYCRVPTIGKLPHQPTWTNPRAQTMQPQLIEHRCEALSWLLFVQNHSEADGDIADALYLSQAYRESPWIHAVYSICI